MIQLTYNNVIYTAHILIPGYATNGNTALQLFTEEEDPETDYGLVVSVNVDQAIPGEFVCIKNWSEFEGIEQPLIDAGIIEEGPVNVIPSGFVRIPVYVLTDKALEEAQPGH